MDIYSFKIISLTINMRKFSFKTEHSDTIHYNNNTINGVRRGDIILRSFGYDDSMNRLNNLRKHVAALFLPDGFQHLYMYIGKERVIDIAANYSHILHEQSIYTSLDKYPRFARSPELFTFIRLTNDSTLIDSAIEWLHQSAKLGFHYHKTGVGNIIHQDTDGKQYFDGLNCLSAIVQAYEQSGFVFNRNIPTEGLTPLESWVVKHFDTGYMLYKNAVVFSTFERDQPNLRHLSPQQLTGEAEESEKSIFYQHVIRMK